MYCRKITYTDFNDVERTEEFYFNMTEAELLEWMTTDSDYTLDEVIEQMRKKMNVRGIINATKDLIYRSYGEKSLDGRRFIKTKEVKDSFMETNAYSALFMELATDGAKAAEFVNSIIPKNLAASVDKMIKDHPGATPEELVEMAKSGK